MLRWDTLTICRILGNAAHANQHLMWLNLRNRDILQVHDRLVTVDTGDKSFASIRSHFSIPKANCLRNMSWQMKLQWPGSSWLRFRAWAVSSLISSNQLRFHHTELEATPFVLQMVPAGRVELIHVDDAADWSFLGPFKRIGGGVKLSEGQMREITTR